MTTARLSLCVWFLASAALMVSPAAGQTPALWTGLAGTTSYNDPGNWDTPAVPVNGGGTTYSVTIPAGAAVEFDVPGPQEVTDFDLGDNATLTVNPGRSLTVLDFAEIYGLVTTDNGVFSAPAAAAQFPGNRARAHVSGGGSVTIAAPSYSSTGRTERGTFTILSATGTGSLLDLSSLLSITDNHSTGNYEQIHVISATNDGVIDLSKVQNISGPTYEESDRLDIVVNTGGNVILDALQSTTAGNGEVRFAIDVPTYGLPALETAVNTQFDLSDGRTLNLPLLVSHSGEGYSLGDGATVNLPELISLTNAVLSAGAGATFDAPKLADISGSVINLSPAWTLTNDVIGSMDNARISVADGTQFGTAFGDVSATAYASTSITWRGTVTVLSATGTGSLLDLSSLLSIADNHYTAGYEQVHQVLATDNAVMDLSGVQDIAGPTYEASDRLDFIVNSGGHIDLSSLQSVTSGAGHVQFLVSAGGQLTMGEVTISNQMTVDVTDDTSLLEFVGGLHLDPTSSLNVRGGAKVRIGGNFSFDYTDEAPFACDTAVFEFDGTGEQWMEVGGADLGLPGPGAGNFGITQLIVGTETQATTVVLVDLIDNGNRASNEALYLYGSGGLDGLRIPGESTLLIGDINVYALIDGQMEHLNAWFGPGITRVEYDQGWVVLPEPATLALLGLGGFGLLLRRRRTR